MEGIKILRFLLTSYSDRVTFNQLKMTKTSFKECSTNDQKKKEKIPKYPARGRHRFADAEDSNNNKKNNNNNKEWIELDLYEPRPLIDEEVDDKLVYLYSI